MTGRVVVTASETDTTAEIDTIVAAAVAAAVAALVGSAPGALDTLGELADALASDEGAAAALTTLVGTVGDRTTALETIAAALPATIVSVGNDNWQQILRPSGSDDTPALKAKIAAGVRDVRLQPGATFHFLTSVGDDLASINDTLNITAWGATCLVGTASGGDGGITGSTAGLGRTADFGDDPTVGWLFFPNTANSAVLGNGTVVTTTATQTTGAPFGTSMHRLRIMGGTWDGQGHNVGLAFGNHAPILLDGLVIRQLRIGLAGNGYTDGMEARRIHHRSPLADSWLVYTTDPGDTVILDGIKTDPGGGLWKARNCRGGEIRSPVGGVVDVTSVEAVKITGLHTEADQAGYTTSIIILRNSSLTMEESLFYTSKTAGKNPIRVIDTAGAESGSRLRLSSVVFRHVIRPSELPDLPRSPDVYVESTNGNTRVTFDDCVGEVVVSGLTTTTRGEILVGSGDAGLQTAITAARGAFLHRTEMRYRDGAWSVDRAGGVPRLLRPFMTAPVLSNPNVTSGAPGSLGLGSRYDVVCAAIGETGLYGPQSNVSSTNTVGNVGTDGSYRVIVTAPVRGLYRFWRKNAAGVGATPDVYVDLLLDAGTNRVYDTGLYLNGIAWAAAVDVPNTVAAVNHQSNAVLRGDGLAVLDPVRSASSTVYRRTNLPRLGKFENIAPLTSQKPFVTTVFLEQGDPVTGLTFGSGGTALASGNHQWAAILDVATRTILAVTGDYLATAWAATTKRTFDLTATYLVPASGDYYAMLLIDATTVPSLEGVAHNSSIMNNDPPVPCGSSADTGITVPQAVGWSAGALSAFAGVAWVGVKTAA